jgi:hypothetical protein
VKLHYNLLGRPVCGVRSRSFATIKEHVTCGRCRRAIRYGKRTGIVPHNPGGMGTGT